MTHGRGWYNVYVVCLVLYPIYALGYVTYVFWNFGTYVFWELWVMCYMYDGQVPKACIFVLDMLHVVYDLLLYYYYPHAGC